VEVSEGRDHRLFMPDLTWLRKKIYYRPGL
jgi:hypothetical protein